MDKVVRLEPPRSGAYHVDIRFDVDRNTAISAQWNVGRTHLIVTFGDFQGGLRVLLRPHAVARLKEALDASGSSGGDMVHV